MEIEHAAVRFCTVVESVETYQRDDFLVVMIPLLADLIGAAAAMPPVDLPEGTSDADYESPAISPEAWRERLLAIGGVLGGWNIYWELDPLAIDDAVHDPEVMAGDLNDDLADIWRDLKAGLLGLEQGGPRAVIRWEWRFTFHTHWGAHATSALSVLHARKCKTDYGTVG